MLIKNNITKPYRSKIISYKKQNFTSEILVRRVGGSEKDNFEFFFDVKFF